MGWIPGHICKTTPNISYNLIGRVSGDFATKL